jgi:hypothetical protein
MGDYVWIFPAVVLTIILAKLVITHANTKKEES